MKLHADKNKGNIKFKWQVCWMNTSQSTHISSPRNSWDIIYGNWLCLMCWNKLTHLIAGNVWSSLPEKKCKLSERHQKESIYLVHRGRQYSPNGIIRALISFIVHQYIMTRKFDFWPSEFNGDTTSFQRHALHRWWDRAMLSTHR